MNDVKEDQAIGTELFGVLLDSACDVCGGKGFSGNRKCDVCYGTGRTLTDAGESLLGFISRHSGPRVR